MIGIVEKNGKVGFRLRVAPRARCSEMQGEHDGALKLRIAAPPVEGKANAECERFVAELLAVSASRVAISHGASSKSKLVLVSGLTRQELEQRLKALCTGAEAGTGKSRSMC